MGHHRRFNSATRHARSTGIQREVKTMNVATLATELKTEPRILRRFLRTTRENVGSGSRYVFKDDELDTIKITFLEWAKGRRLNTAPKTVTVANQTDDDQQVWEEEEASRAQRGAPSVAEQLRRMRTNPRAR